MQWLLCAVFTLLLARRRANALEARFFDDNVLYRVSTHGNDLLNTRLESDTSRTQVVPIVSTDDERYICVLPSTDREVCQFSNDVNTL